MFNQLIKIFRIEEGRILSSFLIDGVSYQGSNSIKLNNTTLTDFFDVMIIIPKDKYKAIKKGDKIIKEDKEYSSLKELNKDCVTVMSITEHNFGRLANIELNCK